MLKNVLFSLFIFCIPTISIAENGTYSMDDYLTVTPDNTKCATKIFEQALRDNVSVIESVDDADATEIDTWVHYAFAQPGVLRAILACPELQSRASDETIVFETVSYTFPNGREIKINYETQKHVLEQRLLLADKKPLPTGDISPNLSEDVANGNIWVNVDPAWYAILVAEHGSLDEFVGAGKNNVVALRYIQDNIKKLYPADHSGPFRADCTSRTAIADNTDMVNRAVTITVGGAPSKYTPETSQEEEQVKLAENNDYYVMGDGNLQWITWAEVATDVILTIVTWGGYEVVKGSLQAARGARAYLKGKQALKTLHTSRSVSKWIKASKRADNVTQAIKTLDKAQDSYDAIYKIERESTLVVKNLERERDLLRARNTSPKAIHAIESELEFATKQANASKQALQTAEKMKNIEHILKNGKGLSPAKQKRLRELEQQIQNLEQEISGGGKPASEAKQLRQKLTTARQERNTIRNQTKLSESEIEQLTQEMNELKNTYAKQLNELKDLHAQELATLEKSSNVQKYKEVSTAERELAHNLYLLRQGKIAFRANRGLLPVRAIRGWKELRKGIKSAKNMDKSVKVIRANTSGVSAKVNDWLFHSTMRNITALGKVPAQLSTLNMIVKIAGEMYDYTDTATGDFTNNIDMKPFLLLGADNLEGYENIINQGMWLFWTGSSTSAADDDAAFLQAMSFAEKFHQDLVEVQDEYNVMACDVDIYVVRPIIRNPGTENQELYYLFMNDTPWTTHGYNEPNNGSEPSSISKKDESYESNIAYSDDNYEPESTESYSYDSYTITDTNGGTTHFIEGIGRYTEPKYDGTKIGQPCTKPSTKAGAFSNTIYPISAKYNKYPAFAKAMITKFRTEGGCGEHPADRGGYTCYGVSSKYFPQVKKPGFSRADAQDIAFNSFFKRYRINELPDAISGDVFMALWGTGSKPASIGLLQKLLGVKQTNIIDSETINAAKNYQGDLRTKFLDAREAMFRRGQREFRKGWLNALKVYRANGCHTIAE